MYNIKVDNEKLAEERRNVAQCLVSSRGQSLPTLPDASAFPFSSSPPETLSNLFYDAQSFEFRRPNKVVKGLDELEEDNEELRKVVGAHFDSEEASWICEVCGGSAGVATTTCAEANTPGLALGQWELKGVAAPSGFCQTIASGFFKVSFRQGTAKIIDLEFSSDDINMVNLCASSSHLDQHHSLF